MDYMEPAERQKLEDQIGLWGENGAFARAAKTIIRIAKKKKQSDEEREAEEAEMEEHQMTEEDLEERRREIQRKKEERARQSLTLGQTRIIFKVCPFKPTTLTFTLYRVRTRAYTSVMSCVFRLVTIFDRTASSWK